MTREEVRALAFIAFLLALSAAVRVAAGPGDAALLADDVDLQLLGEQSQAALEEEEARSRPLAEGETVDPNRAAAADLDRLPGVGPATAERIVAARDSAPFATPEDLLRVRGIGPATVEKVRPWLDLGPLAVPPGAARAAAPAGAAGGPAPRAPPGKAAGRARGGPALIDLNRATSAELQTLKGIGPALAERIIAYRDSAGPFRSADDLLAVRGIGPATLERIRARIRLR